MKIRLSLVFAFILMGLLTPQAQARQEAWDTLGRIPVQHNGRIKPFESFARESALFVTGRARFEKMHPTELVWRWMADPEKWVSTPMIPVSLEDVRKDFGLAVIHNRVSPEMVLNQEGFLDKAQRAGAMQAKKEKLSLADQKRLEIYEKAVVFRDIASGQLPGWVIQPEDPRLKWFTFKDFAPGEASAGLASHYPQDKVARAAEALRVLLEKLRQGPDPAAAASFAESLHSILESRDIVLDTELLDLEMLYNRSHPFEWAWKFYVMAALAMAFVLLFAQGRGPGAVAGIGLFAAGFAIHLFGFYLRCRVAGRPPVTNMYESMIWVSWGVAFFSLIFFAVYRSLVFPMVAGLLSALALILAQSFPVVLDPSISPLVPVLRNNMWLTVHVLTITLSYGAFLLAWGIGHSVLFSLVFSRGNRELPRKLSEFLYRTLQVGVILLACGTVLGGVWANYSWGRFWGWDPKETWALIALLGYLAVLHGRFAGWLGTFGLAASSVAAFLGVLMAWYGVNYVLAAGLHSYGFGGGGVVYVGIAALADLALVFALGLGYRSKSKFSSPREKETAATLKI